MAVTAPISDDRVSRRRTVAPAATSEGTHLLAGALERYVWKVAEALGVPREGASFEVTDTATAYIALGCRAVAHPDRDVMLVWSATHGWAVSIETDPAEPLIVLGRLSGAIVQAPEAVAGLVAESMTRPGVRQVPVASPSLMGWSDLAECMERYAP
ncbi:DUF6292 family protein [Lentzea flaviverrucosa]|uniref:DUF6292 domain-containing protein n=1 Tax=Lentzea flaviverrucosa TaxID=200379 RepID=A0A1H9GVC0_9PSEU|nr:DUF6292 family protein [Lentzea flaviverrucosa]RDI34787.1 hypothetical protein DFR72_101536 [Lentzea flaviverrucosa]SEQ54027.1 hypothetical protein SAMN05216195_102681 [Lentzea flaviverrucosa]